MILLKLMIKLFSKLRPIDIHSQHFCLKLEL